MNSYKISLILAVFWSATVLAQTKVSGMVFDNMFLMLMLFLRIKIGVSTDENGRFTCNRT
jgi:hypothetical protein